MLIPYYLTAEEAVAGMGIKKPRLAVSTADGYRNRRFWLKLLES